MLSGRLFESTSHLVQEHSDEPVSYLLSVLFSRDGSCLQGCEMRSVEGIASKYLSFSSRKQSSILSEERYPSYPFYSCATTMRLFILHAVGRRLCPVLLFCTIDLKVRWVPIESNSADVPSRAPESFHECKRGRYVT